MEIRSSFRIFCIFPMTFPVYSSIHTEKATEIAFPGNKQGNNVALDRNGLPLCGNGAN